MISTTDRMIRRDLRYFIPTLTDKNHPSSGTESFLWSTRIARVIRHSQLMLLRNRRSRLEFGTLELALLVVILASVARFDWITAALKEGAPVDSSSCGSRIIIVVDDSPVDGVAVWSKNEG